mmetsp:Transcript_87789/g.244831  ORF Transcript_87789/g.244831 Transcript_87789/m.244831 type:complete len:226 (+) Transcript_87789:854-1531(+)
MRRKTFRASSTASSRFLSSSASVSSPEATSPRLGRDAPEPLSGPLSGKLEGPRFRRSSAISGSCFVRACRPSRSERASVPLGQRVSIASPCPSLNPFSRIAPTALPMSEMTEPGSCSTSCRLRNRTSGSTSTSRIALSSFSCQRVAALPVRSTAALRRCSGLPARKAAALSEATATPNEAAHASARRTPHPRPRRCLREALAWHNIAHARPARTCNARGPTPKSA